jgi:uncharacterized OB-fold protein
MQEDALDKVREGVTTLDEVLRVVPFEFAVTSDCPKCGMKVVSGARFCSNCGSACTPKTKSKFVPDLESAPEGILQR